MRQAEARRKSSLVGTLARLVAVFLAVLVVLTALWPTIAPLATRAAAWMARPCLRWVESPNVSVLEVRGDELWVHRIVGPGQIKPFTWFDRYAFYAFIPLTALFLATPALGLAKRLTRLAISWVLLWVFQTAYVVFSVQLAYAAVGLLPLGAFAGRWLNGWQLGVRILWEAAPLILWGAFTVRVWARTLHDLREGSSEETKSVSNRLTALRWESKKGWES